MKGKTGAEGWQPLPARVCRRRQAVDGAPGRANRARRGRKAEGDWRVWIGKADFAVTASQKINFQ